MKINYGRWNAGTRFYIHFFDLISITIFTIVPTAVAKAERIRITRTENTEKNRES